MAKARTARRTGRTPRRAGRRSRSRTLADDRLYLGTYGPEDPTRATLLFAAAIRMRMLKGASVRVALLGEGVRLMDPKIAGAIPVTGARTPYKTIQDMIDAAVAAGVEIHC